MQANPKGGTGRFPVSLCDVRAAADVISDVVVRTPVLESQDVNAMLGGRLVLKPECLQRSGAFKMRGAYHRMLNLSEAERDKGVISYSSGNHARGLAIAARLLGSSAVIVMPEDTPLGKMCAVLELGAEVETYDRDTQQSADVIARIIARTGRIEVPPSAHPQVLAGAGTAALELFEDAGPVDSVLVPCGGGGLTAATALVMSEVAPATQVYAVEPELFDDTARSLDAGKPVANPTGRRTICDAIMTPMPNEVTFPINHALLAGGLTVTDEETRAAMRFAFEHFKIVTEPGAVVGLAAVLSGRVPIKGRTVATFITGGNIDPSRFAQLLGDEA